MRHIGLLDISCLYLAISFDFNTDTLKVEFLSQGIAADREEDSVVLFLHNVAILLESDDCFSRRVRLLELHGDRTPDEFGSMALHIGADAVCHVLVEATKQDGPHHNCGVVAEGCQEACTLEGHIGGTHNKSLAWCCFLRKDIIAGYTEFLVPWDPGILRTATNSDNDLISSDSLYTALPIVKLNSVCIFECSV